MPQTLESARRNYSLSALIAARAVSEAVSARPRGGAAVASVVLAHQVAQARTSDLAVTEMLVEQQIEREAEALLNSFAFTTDPQVVVQMVESTDTDQAFERLIESLVQDAARAAESVAVVVRKDIYHVRYVSPPCCARCAILAGRVYRWSSGFRRHPGCDCTMIPTTVASPYAQSPDALVEAGLVRGLSKTDLRAVADGADLGQVVNVRSRKSGLLVGGHSLIRGDRPTPAGIYRAAGDDRAAAVKALRRWRYIT